MCITFVNKPDLLQHGCWTSIIFWLSNLIMALSACGVLMNLVPALQVEILVRWLYLHDVVKLDSALCSSLERNSFLKIYDEDFCVFDNGSSNQMEWVLKRNIKVSSAEFTQTHPNAATRVKFFQRTGRHLRTLVTTAVDVSPNLTSEISAMCRNLVKLVFSQNDLRRNDICSILPHLPRLQHLDLSLCTNVTGEIIANINTHAQSLKILNLSGCQIDERALLVEALQGNHTIHTLLITECKQISICLPFIHTCKALTALYVNEITLRDVFTILRLCPTLTLLSAGMPNSHIPRMSDEELRTLISLIQNLRVLHLYHAVFFQWGETQLETLVEGTPFLRALFVARLNGSVTEIIKSTIDCVSRFVTAGTISSNHDALHSSQLHTLLADDVTSDETENILQICPNLVNLAILEFGTISTDAFELMSVIENSSIRILDVRECEAFYSADILPLRNLLSLSLDLCFELKHSDLVKLVDQNPNLRKLSLIGCAYLTQRSLLYIVQQCKFLEELAFDNINTGDNYLTYMRGEVRAVDTTLIEGLIRIQHPHIKLSLVLQPELR